MDKSFDFEDMNASSKEISDSIKVMKSNAPSALEFLEAFTSVGAVKESERGKYFWLILIAQALTLMLKNAKLREPSMNETFIFRKINMLFYFYYNRIGRGANPCWSWKFQCFGF